MDSVSLPYAEIDAPIERWVNRHGLSLNREWQGEARFWHLPQGRECFQIAVEQPNGGTVVVRASSVETDDDAELSGRWTVTTGDLEQALVTATELIELWHRRVRTVS